MTHDSIIHPIIIHECSHTLAAVFAMLTRLTVAATLLLGLAGCGSDDPGPASSSSAAAQAGCTHDTTSGRDGVNLLPVAPAKVTLLDPGTGDRRLPAASPELATPQSVTLVTTSSVQSPGSTDAQTVTVPMQARFGCDDPTDLEMTLGAVTSPDDTLADQLVPVEGSPAGLAIGPGSMPISLRLLPADDAGPEARLAVEQSLLQALQVSVALPTEPVAVGARWRTERTIDAAATVTQQIDATLRSWDGDRVVIDISVDETPVNSVFAIPGSDATLTIARFTNAGTGQITMDLRRGLPVAGTLEMIGARELVGTDPAQPLIQRTGLSVSWR